MLVEMPVGSDVAALQGSRSLRLQIHVARASPSQPEGGATEQPRTIGLTTLEALGTGSSGRSVVMSVSALRSGAVGGGILLRIFKNSASKIKI